MKATGLMIGDWVRCTDPKPFRITDIETEWGTPYFCVTGTDCLAVDGGDLQPIPLTAEILEKNGFKRSEVFVEWKYEDDDVYMIYKPFPYLKIEMDEFVVAFPCEYVHELQHALRLCGIDKTIEL